MFSLSDVVSEFTRATNDPSVDSVEGIMFSREDGVVMSGEFVDGDRVEPDRVNRLGRSVHTNPCTFTKKTQQILMCHIDRT